MAPNSSVDWTRIRPSIVQDKSVRCWGGASHCRSGKLLFNLPQRDYAYTGRHFDGEMF
jgi:hypothetical protein